MKMNETNYIQQCRYISKCWLKEIRLERGYKMGFRNTANDLFVFWAGVTQEFNLWQFTDMYTSMVYNFLYVRYIYLISQKKNEKKVKTSTFDQDRVIRTKFTLPPQTTTTNINTWNKGSQENEYHQKWKVTSANEGPRSERPEKKQASDFSILLKGVCVQATAKDTRTKRDKVARVFRAVTRKETATQRTLKICRGTSLSI